MKTLSKEHCTPLALIRPQFAMQKKKKITLKNWLQRRRLFFMYLFHNLYPKTRTSSFQHTSSHILLQFLHTILLLHSLAIIHNLFSIHHPPFFNVNPHIHNHLQPSKSLSSHFMFSCYNTLTNINYNSPQTSLNSTSRNPTHNLLYTFNSLFTLITPYPLFHINHHPQVHLKQQNKLTLFVATGV